ncbi:unnamed protein product [Pylaiella littoralis]
MPTHEAVAAAAAPAAASEVPAAPPAGLSSLDDAVLNLALGYLDSDSLVSCLAACRVLGSAAKNDDLWQEKCLEDWGEKRRVCPERRFELVPTFLGAWRGWRRAFNGYDALDVKRVSVWWAGVEAWMSQHLPEVMDTLNTGVSEEELDRAAELLGWPLPTHLRLLYRFHNGQQWLPWDERLNSSVGEDGGRPAVLPQVAGIGTSLGLLGGYCYYHNETTSKLFSLQRGVVAGLHTADVFGGEDRGYFEACANRWGMNLAAVRERGGFLLAAGHNMSKRAWVGRDGNVRFDGKSTPLMGVFDAAPITASSPPEQASGIGAVDGAAGAGTGADGGKQHHRGGNLMVWLEEYLRRLEAGHYGVRSRWQEAVRGPGDDEHRILNVRGVWLFPREGGEGCVKHVSQGVEIQASPVFAPEASADRTDLMWAYTVRMRLLADHPSRPPTMSSCQLSTRQWEIDGPNGFHRGSNEHSREVSGDGVVGEHPTLRVAAPAAGGVAGIHPTGDDDPSFFECESCTTLESTPGTMGGHFSFTPGDLDSPRGAPFNARVPTFDLVDPTFIF